MPSTTHTPPDLTSPVPDMAARATVAVGLIGVGLIHVIDSVSKYSETRYLFWMYIGLILSALAVAATLLFTRSRLAMPAAIILIATALASFILNRTVGLPHAKGDIGNWTEPIGLANMFVEGAILFVAIPAQLLAARTAHPRPPDHPPRATPGAAATGPLSTPGDARVLELAVELVVELRAVGDHHELPVAGSRRSTFCLKNSIEAGAEPSDGRRQGGPRRGGSSRSGSRT